MKRRNKPFMTGGGGAASHEPHEPPPWLRPRRWLPTAGGGVVEVEVPANRNSIAAKNLIDNLPNESKPRAATPLQRGGARW